MNRQKLVVSMFWIIIQCMSFANQLNLKTLANPCGTFINLAQSIEKKHSKSIGFRLLIEPSDQTFQEPQILSDFSGTCPLGLLKGKNECEGARVVWTVDNVGFCFSLCSPLIMNPGVYTQTLRTYSEGS